MKNKEIEFLLTLKDQLTAKWGAVTDKVKSGAAGLVKSFQANWAAISAGAFAAFAAVQKAMDFAQEYAKHEQSMESFRGMVQKLGLDATVEFDKIRKASGGLIDDKALVESANRAMSLGIPLKNLTGFLEIARAKARDMGTDTKTAFNDLVVALGRQSAPILDNLGVIVKTEAANEAYARSLGKTVAQLTDAEKKQAFMNAALDAGREALSRQNLELDTLAEKMQRMEALMENAKIWAGQAVVYIGAALVGILASIGVAGIKMSQTFIWPIARMEAALDAMGLTTSTRMRDAEKQLQSFRDTAWNVARDSFSAIGDALDKALNRNNSPVNIPVPPVVAAIEPEVVKAEAATKRVWVAIDGIKEKTKKFAIEYEQTISSSVVESARIIRLAAKDMVTTFGEVYNAIWEINGGFESALLSGLDSIHYGIVDGIGGAWESMFGEANSLLEMFIKSFVEQLTSNVVKSAIGGLLSLFPGGGFLGGIFGGLFHEGGTVPKAHGGAFINAPPSKEFPILVRGGETIRTEAQEAGVQRALASTGTTINIHVNGPVADPRAFKEIIEKGMRETGITDAAQYFRNSRSNLVLQS